ncbi:unnamed protein product [Chrysodeixis includens]|uniref:ATP synthase subunit b n=1 Tax=Chrysodeixis includens TaxID=689277 RepID=A0A9N8KRN0_CHRIL|nr:unnamed protein product [Chrysodeixis includens]
MFVSMCLASTRNMLIPRLIQLRVLQPRFLVPIAYSTHSKDCPANKRKVCPGAGGLKKKGAKGGKGGKGGVKGGGVCEGIRRGAVHDSADGGDRKSTSGLLRAIKPGKVRMGLIPEEWFLFFKPMTGVTGPYIFMIVLGNYLVSKEKFIMEHEYYLGLSIGVVLYLVITRFGDLVGKTLDKGVDAIAYEFHRLRQEDLDLQKKIVEAAKLAKWRAEGQKELMDAKKENIAMQLEAVYRERLNMVYQTVRGRMEYHVRKHKIYNRIHQRWMVQWILAEVKKAITPELKKKAIASAIEELNSIAAKMKK